MVVNDEKFSAESCAPLALSKKVIAVSKCRPESCKIALKYHQLIHEADHSPGR